MQLDVVGFCWQSPAPNAQGLFSAVCVDGSAQAPNARLRVQAGETLTLRFGALTPRGVSYAVGDASVELQPGNPVRFAATFPAGSTPVVIFFTRWLQGDATYAVQLEVTPGARPIALTG